MHYRQYDHEVRVCAFDILAEGDDDLRKLPLMLALRLIGPNDYSVLEDGQTIGRIRLAQDRMPATSLWNVTVTIPGPPFGDANFIDEAMARGLSRHGLRSGTSLAQRLAKA
jgi:hypothetical protein